MNTPDDEPRGLDWLEAELADTLDEDYELELSEPALSMEIRKIYNGPTRRRCRAWTISARCCGCRPS